MKRINRCLNKQLLNLCQQSVYLEKLQEQLKPLLPDHLVKQCVVGSFNKGCLILHVYHQEFATELRYLLPTLRDRLRTEAGLFQLISIKLEIIADQYPKETPLTCARKNNDMLRKLLEQLKTG